MARAYLNIMSYNCTGLNAVKSDWIRDTMEACKVDLMQIQEHFKKNRNIESFFKKSFPKCDSYVVPGVRSVGQDSGRAMGGVAQLSTKNLSLRKERVTTSQWRLQAQILHCSGGQRILWINAYFPTDPRL